MKSDCRRLRDKETNGALIREGCNIPDCRDGVASLAVYRGKKQSREPIRKDVLAGTLCV